MSTDAWDRLRTAASPHAKAVAYHKVIQACCVDEIEHMVTEAARLVRVLRDKLDAAMSEHARLEGVLAFATAREIASIVMSVPAVATPPRMSADSSPPRRAASPPVDATAGALQSQEAAGSRADAHADEDARGSATSVHADGAPPPPDSQDDYGTKSAARDASAAPDSDSVADPERTLSMEHENDADVDTALRKSSPRSRADARDARGGSQAPRAHTSPRDCPACQAYADHGNTWRVVADAHTCNLHQCDQCVYASADPGAIAKHAPEHDPSNTHVCGTHLCMYSTNDEARLAKHTRRYHRAPAPAGVFATDDTPVSLAAVAANMEPETPADDDLSTDEDDDPTYAPSGDGSGDSDDDADDSDNSHDDDNDGGRRLSVAADDHGGGVGHACDFDKCGFVASSAGGLGSHRRHAHGIAGTSATTQYARARQQVGMTTARKVTGSTGRMRKRAAGGDGGRGAKRVKK